MKNELAICLQTGTSLIFWGEPGVGKTSMVKDVCESLGFCLERVVGSSKDPTEFNGLPMRDSDTERGVRMVPPQWAINLSHAERPVLFLDELSDAPPAVQACMQDVALDKRVGDLQLPESMPVIACANPPGAAGGLFELKSALANRLVHLDWHLDPIKWTEGFMAGFKTGSVPKLSEDWQSTYLMRQAEVASFIRHRPTQLHKMPDTDDQRSRAWPSPRQWETATRLLTACHAVGLIGTEEEIDETALNLVAGAVGRGAASEFFTWKWALDLPDPEELLANPRKFMLPDTGDKQFAVLSSVVQAAVSKMTKPRWTAAWKILAKASRMGARDVAAISCRQLAQTEFVVKHGIPKPELAEVGSILDALKLSRGR